MEEAWRARVIEHDGAIAELLAATRRIAVLGIKPSSRSFKPAHYVPRYLQQAGFDVLPVPVYYPDVEIILGEPVYRTVAAVPPPIDVVDVFRRSEDIPPHVEDLLAAAPAAVWFQAGIRNDAVAEVLARAGVLIVQDRCLMVEHRRLGVGPT
jgi:predicted CoA-binding protein